MQGDDKVLFRDRALAKKLFHQFVLALGDQLDQGLMGGRGLFPQPHRDLGQAPTAGAIRFVHKRLHGYQVDDAAKVGILSVAFQDGQLHRNDLAAKTFAQGVEGAFAVGTGMIHLVDDDHARQVELLAKFPNPAGRGFYAAGGVHDEQSGLDR